MKGVMDISFEIGRNVFMVVKHVSEGECSPVAQRRALCVTLATFCHPFPDILWCPVLSVLFATCDASVWPLSWIKKTSRQSFIHHLYFCCNKEVNLACASRVRRVRRRRGSCVFWARERAAHLSAVAWCSARQYNFDTLMVQADDTHVYSVADSCDARDAPNSVICCLSCQDEPGCGHEQVSEGLDDLCVACLGMFDGFRPTPLPSPPFLSQSVETRAPRSAPLRTLLSPADVRNLREHIMRVTDVWCLSAVTIRMGRRSGAECLPQHVVGPQAHAWHTMLAKCVKDQPCDRLFLELYWLIDKHAVSVTIPSVASADDRVEPSRCHQKHSRRAIQERPRHSQSLSAWVIRLGHVVQIVRADKANAVFPAQPWPPHTHHATSDNGWATTWTILELADVLDHVMNPDPLLGHGQYSRQRRLTSRHGGVTASRRAVLHPTAQHFVLAAMRLGHIPQLQDLRPDASPLRHRRLIRRHRDKQGMATTVIGGLGVAGNHRLLQRTLGVDNWVASLARLQRWRFPGGRCKGQRAARCSRKRSSQSPLPKSLWNVPCQKRLMTRTTTL